MKAFKNLDEDTFDSEATQVLLNQDLTPLSWENFFEKDDFILVDDNSFHVYRSGNTGPTLFLIHGAGSSALSWGPFTRELLKLTDIRVVAIDLRGHGLTKTTNDHKLDKSTLVNDVVAVIDKCISNYSLSKPISLIGHSLGGAIATWVSTTGRLDPIGMLSVIDAIEGVALDSSGMERFLESRPSIFKSIEHAINYNYSLRKTKNLEADRLIMPSQVEKINGDENETRYKWKVDLIKTKEFWRDWFIGLSKAFSTAKSSKLLILVDTSRLDKDLIIAQMQGAFRVELAPNCSHCIHEEEPAKVADFISRFLKYNGIC